jgi:hypothetical protein
MTIYGVVSTIVVIAVVAAGLGVLFPMPLFGSRRLIALGVGLALLLFAVPFAQSLRTPEEAAKERVEERARAEAKHDTYDHVEAKPETYITMRAESDVQFGMGRISGQLTNSSSFPIGNLKLKCQVQAETGKVIKRYDATILKRVPAKSTIPFGPVEVGYVDPQASSLGCRVVDADILHEAAAATQDAAKR